MVFSLWNSQISDLDTKEAPDSETRTGEHQACRWTRCDGALGEKGGLARAGAQREEECSELRWDGGLGLMNLTRLGSF